MPIALVVVLSLLGGALFLLMIAGMATLIVLHLKARKMHGELVKAMAEFTGETAKIIEGARSNFAGIRQDTKAALENQSVSITTILKAQAERFEAAMSKINGEALTRASIEALRALRELSALTVTLKNLLVDHQSPAAELGPEEYGPSDELFVGQSDTARLDDVAARDEATIYQTQFGEGLPTVRTEQ